MRKKGNVIVIGAGVNGLVTAFYLAKAGLYPLVLERRPNVGGCAITEEFYPGFRCSTLAHSAGPLLPKVIRDMRLEKFGLKLLTPEAAVTTLPLEGRALTVYRDLNRTVSEIATISEKDAAKYAEFQRSLAKMGRIIADVLRSSPPDIDQPSRAEFWKLIQMGRAVQKLGHKDMYRLLRWGPMAVADVAGELFETELLRATIAARGIFGCFLGPWSAGSGLAFLLRAAGDPHVAGLNWFAEGGIGAITQAMKAAAEKKGAEIRTDAEVTGITVKNGEATGVALSNGDELPARAIISSADPRQTLLKFVDPIHLEPSFAHKLQNYRMRGCLAKVNLALSGLPSFPALEGNVEGLGGRIQIGPEIDYIEKAFDEAKYGEFSKQPYLEVTFPSVNDPSLAPAGNHVASIYMQYAPFKLKDKDWDSQRVALGDTVVKTLAQYAPKLPDLILSHQIITPQDLQDTYGLTEGHIYHGELALDQFFTMRPLLGWSRYQTPIRNLYLCGSGTHPGVGLTGGSGMNAAREILKALKG